MPHPSFVDRMKERKLVQWTLAYLAGAWALLEASGFLTDLFQWPRVFLQVMTGLVIVGFLVTLILSWYHGEKGRQRVSGPELLILTMLFLVAGIGLSFLGRPDGTENETQAIGDPASDTSVSPGSRDSRPSLAVLPFENRASPEDQNLVDGVFDEVLTHLSSETGIRLASRTSMEAFRDGSLTVGEIGDTLGVLYVLEGGIQIEEGRVRLNLQLIDAANETHVWTDLDEREFQGSQLDFQTEIAINAAHRILIAIVQAEWDRFGRISTESDRAYDLYLRHRTAIRSSDDPRPFVEILEHGIELLEEAIGLDPDFGWAYAFLGGAHAGMYVYSEPSAESAAKAKEALERAIELVDEREYLAWFMAEYYRDVEKDYGRAIEECGLIESTLNSAAGLHYRAGLERRAGRWFEALETLGRYTAARPTAIDGQNRTAETYHMMRRYDEALVHYDSALALDPDYAAVKGRRALLLWQRDGDPDPLLEANGEPDWWRLMQDGDWARALEKQQGSQTSLDRYSVLPRSFSRGMIHLSANDSSNSLREFQDAIDTLLGRLDSYPNDDRILRSLGLSYALSGQPEKALEAGYRALELMPIERGALVGSESLATMAWIYGALGPADSAMVYLERLFSVPGRTRLSARLVSEWIGIDVVRQDPRFLELLRRSGLN